MCGKDALAMGGQEEGQADAFRFIAPVIQITQQLVVGTDPVPEKGLVGLVRCVWQSVRYRGLQWVIRVETAQEAGWKHGG